MTTFRHTEMIELSENLQFQQRAWLVQRAGWIIMLFIIIAALLGFFGGDGPLNHASLGEATSPLQVNYNLFARALKATHLRLQIGPEAITGNEVDIWLGREYLDNTGLQDIAPAPEKVVIASDRIIYTFLVEETDSPVTITFVIEPQRAGRLSGRIGLEAGVSYDFQHFIYP